MSARKWADMWMETVLKVFRVHVWVHVRSMLGSVVGSILERCDEVTVNPPGHHFGREWWSKPEALSPLELPPL